MKYQIDSPIGSRRDRESLSCLRPFTLRARCLGFAGLLVLGSVLSSCLSEAPPNVPTWYLDTAQGYPSDAYLAAKGRGRTEREAKRDAAGELAQMFSAQVDFDSTASFRYSEGKGSTDPLRSVAQNVEVRSNQEISGLEYSQRYDAGGWVHVVAYLDRSKVGKLYAERIAENRNKIASLQGQRFHPADTATKNLLAGFILYDYSVDLALRNDLLLQQLQIINKPMHERSAAKIDYNSVQLAAERRKFASRLSFALHYSGDESLVFLGESIADEMTKLGFLRKQSGPNGLLLNVELRLADIEAGNRYQHLAWDLQVSFAQNKNIDGNGGETTLLEFSKSGRESGITRSRTITTLKRLLDEQIQEEFMADLFAYFAKFAGL